MPRTRHIAKAQAMNIPYQHSFKTCKVQKTKVSENQVRRTRSLGGQMHGDSDSRSGRPLKGPKNVRPASLWHFYLHRTWRTCADRQCAATLVGFPGPAAALYTACGTPSTRLPNTAHPCLGADGDGFERAQKTSSLFLASQMGNTGFHRKACSPPPPAKHEVTQRGRNLPK